MFRSGYFKESEPRTLYLHVTDVFESQTVMRTYQPRQYYAQVKEEQAFPQKDSLRTFCFMNLCFLLCFFMFSWRKSTIIKYSLGYVGERFAGFLEIQIYAPWPSYCNNIFVLHLLMATMVISHRHSLQRQ